MSKVIQTQLKIIQDQIRENGYNERHLRFKHFGIKHYDLRALYFTTPQYRHPLNVFSDKIEYNVVFDSPKDEWMNRIGDPNLYMGYFMKEGATDTDLPTFMIYMRYFDCNEDRNTDEYVYVPMLEATLKIEPDGHYMEIAPNPVFEDPELSDLVFYLGAMASRCSTMTQLHRDLKVCRFNVHSNEVVALNDNPAAYVLGVIRKGPGVHLL